MPYLFRDRVDASLQVAKKLSNYANKNDTIVIGLPRGGIVTGYYIADQLHLPLDMVVPRKIGAPHNEELAVGAITEDGTVNLDHQLLKYLGVSVDQLQPTIDAEKKEAIRRLQKYRGNRPPLDLENKTVILVDDGIATGATAKAAIHSLKAKKAKEIILAVPVMSPQRLDMMSEQVDKLVTVAAPPNFRGVGQFYMHFDQTTDEEVIDLMKKNEKMLGSLGSNTSNEKYSMTNTSNLSSSSTDSSKIES